MNCRDVIPLLVPYLDEALAPPIQEAVLRHVESCRSCGTALVGVVDDGVRFGAFRDVIDVLAPPARLAAGPDPVVRGAARRARWRAIGGVAAAAALAFALALQPFAAGGVDAVLTRLRTARDVAASARYCLAGEAGSRQVELHVKERGGGIVRTERVDGRIVSVVGVFGSLPWAFDAIADALDLAPAQPYEDTLMQRLLAGDELASFLDDGFALTLRGVETVGDHACDVLEARGAAATYALAVDREVGLVRRVRKDDAQGSETWELAQSTEAIASRGFDPASWLKPSTQVLVGSFATPLGSTDQARSIEAVLKLALKHSVPEAEAEALARLVRERLERGTRDTK